MSYLFNKQGEIIIEACDNQEQLMEMLIDAGVDDIIEMDDGAIAKYLLT